MTYPFTRVFAFAVGPFALAYVVHQMRVGYIFHWSLTRQRQPVAYWVLICVQAALSLAMMGVLIWPLSD